MYRSKNTTSLSDVQLAASVGVEMLCSIMLFGRWQSVRNYHLCQNGVFHNSLEHLLGATQAANDKVLYIYIFGGVRAVAKAISVPFSTKHKPDVTFSNFEYNGIYACGHVS